MELSRFNPHTPPSQTYHSAGVVSTRSVDLVNYRNNIRAVSYLIILAIVFYLAMVYMFSPSGYDHGHDHSDLDSTSMQVMLSHVRVVHLGHVDLVSLNATVEVRRDKEAIMSYSLNYSSLHVEVCYRGEELGNTVVSGMGLSATLAVYEVELETDDLRTALFPLVMVAHVDGFLSFMHLPIKSHKGGGEGFKIRDLLSQVKYSCETLVDIKQHKIARQICNSSTIDVGFTFSVPMPFLPSGQVLVQIVLRF